MSLLSAYGVTKTYHTPAIDVEALRAVDLDIEEGELVMVMGPSGNGKTTLLNCLSGLDSIDAGSVHINDTDIHALSDRKRTAHRAETMGFVFQSYNLIPVLSAAENVELPLLVTGVSARPHDGSPMKCSSGLASANAPSTIPISSRGGATTCDDCPGVVAEPAIVWADEPTGNLDTETAADILDLLGELHQAGQTIVMVTHDPGIGQMGDRLVTLRNGEVEDDQPLTPRLGARA